MTDKTDLLPLPYWIERQAMTDKTDLLPLPKPKFRKPKFRIGDLVKVLYPWAGGRVAMITDCARWDEHWGCYTYVVDNGLIRVEEHELKLVERRGGLGRDRIDT